MSQSSRKQDEEMFAFARGGSPTPSSSTPVERPASTTRLMGEVKASSDPDFLTAHADHYLPEVREVVARNPATPVELLEVLATDANDYVRQEVGRNPAVPLPVLRLLASDRNVWTAKMSRGRLGDRVAAENAGVFRSPLPEASRRDLLVALMGHPGTSVAQVVSMVAGEASLGPVMGEVLADRRAELAGFLAETVAASTGLSVDDARGLLHLAFSPAT